MAYDSEIRWVFHCLALHLFEANFGIATLALDDVIVACGALIAQLHRLRAKHNRPSANVAAAGVRTA